jgi:hypothetical protein
MQMPVRDWFEQRSFHHQDFSALASSGEAIRRPAITLILPAREVALGHAVPAPRGARPVGPAGTRRA